MLFLISCIYDEKLFIIFHYDLKNKYFSIPHQKKELVLDYINISITFVPEFERGVAQSGSASALGAEGRRFESCHPDNRLRVISKME